MSNIFDQDPAALAGPVNSTPAPAATGNGGDPSVLNQSAPNQPATKNAAAKTTTKKSKGTSLVTVLLVIIGIVFFVMSAFRVTGNYFPGTNAATLDPFFKALGSTLMQVAKNSSTLLGANLIILAFVLVTMGVIAGILIKKVPADPPDATP